MTKDVTILVPFMMFGWPLVVLLLFLLLPVRRAILAAFLIAWLFLPMASYPITGFPDYTKISATTYGVVLGVILFDAKQLLQFRVSWVDIPMLAWCLVPMASSLTNGLGAYDGAAAVFGHFILWGFPYFIGRLYFFDLQGLRELSVGILIGGLAYVPLCLWEVRMSPQLHNLFYGYHQHQFSQVLRAGGYRPMVFMQHGLMVAMWMTAASLTAAWFWQTKTIEHVGKVPISAIVLVLLATTVICKSLGALLLLLAGIGILFCCRYMRTAAPLLVIIFVIAGYLTARTQFGWSGEQLVEIFQSVDEKRASSLHFRLLNEDRLILRARERPVFGWGAWSRSRDLQDEGGTVVTDSLWIITIGQNGIAGLLSVTLVILLPVTIFLYTTRMRGWGQSELAPAAVLATLLVLYMVDNLFNAMLNPIYLLAAGGLNGLRLDNRVTQHRVLGATDEKR